MTSEPDSEPGSDRSAPVLVLGLGNLLLHDDGVGLELLRELAEQNGTDRRVAFVDGGTQGLALLGLLSGRRALLVLDAVARGGRPGDVHVLRSAAECAEPRGFGAHGGNAGELLAAASLLGDLPVELAVVGVEPGVVRTGVGLSSEVRSALPEACRAAAATLNQLLAAQEAGAPCTR
jgi:hydrogenase maturation protease